MKLIIQIPCYNEADTLPSVLQDLPRQIDGVDTIEFLVIDDGSSDETAKVAKTCGAHHVLQLGTNRGLAHAFQSGLRYALEQGADMVVNTDGDNQYSGTDITRLVQPIINNKADMVIGCRPIVDHPEFGPIKKMMQLLGSWTLRRLSKVNVRDAASGFRAFSRETCLRLNLYTNFSHCTESLIQAGQLGLRIDSVDINVNKKTRPSRLFKGMAQYVYKQGLTMLTMFVLYRPGAFFFSLGSLCMAIALCIGLRFVYLIYLAPSLSEGRTYIPSLILLAVAATIGSLLWIVGIVGELISFQRRIAEETLYLKREESFRSTSS